MKRAITGFLLLVSLSLAAIAANDTATVRVADGFDFPVGKPDAHGYHKARGFTPFGHLGEDWDGDGGGDTDLGDPVYSIGNGIVVFAADVFLGWGNVVIVRHSYVENGQPACVDSLYGHLDKILVKPGDVVVRGQNIGTVGTAHGIYPAHLHFEIRKNLRIGMNRSAFAPDFTNYYDPTQFIAQHRKLPGAPDTAIIAINTFQHPANYYAGPIGSRYAGYRYASRDDAGGGTVRSETYSFNLDSGDEGVVRVKTKQVTRRSAFKVSRYDDIMLN